GPVAVVQIAGLVARRIVCWAEAPGEIAMGERFGLIRFGSRVDVYLGTDAVPRVAVGQTAVGGETVIAEFGSELPAPLVRVSCWSHLSPLSSRMAAGGRASVRSRFG